GKGAGFWEGVGKVMGSRGCAGEVAGRVGRWSCRLAGNRVVNSGFNHGKEIGERTGPQGDILLLKVKSPSDTALTS
nr:hypothetical protein [Tanacetum cinerariifolium]